MTRPRPSRMTRTTTQLMRNVREYQKVVKEHPSYVSPGQVADWYYIPSLDMVGPSRFIGYAAMTGERYRSEAVNGGDTEKHLASKGWFVDLEPGDPQYAAAKCAAERLIPSGRIRQNARFRTLKPEHDG